MTQRHTLLKLLKAYSLITFGALIYALSFNWFFQPNHIAFGGLTGIAQILNRIWPVLPVGAMVIVMNVPLFVAGVRRMGVGLLLSSLYCMAVSSIFVDIMAAVHTFSPMDPLLASLYGGLTLGIIAMTANAFVEDIRLSREAGMNEHFSKPIDLDRLQDVLKRHLKKGAEQSQDKSRE